MPTHSFNQRLHPVISPALLVSFVTTPCLLTILAIQTTTELLEQLGVASEEIFRGDRLPGLHFPDHHEPSSD